MTAGLKYKLHDFLFIFLILHAIKTVNGKTSLNQCTGHVMEGVNRDKYVVLTSPLNSPVYEASHNKLVGVCRVLVSEVEWLISQVDPKKIIQVGSFRVDPKGNQKVKDKQYARSEVHVEDIFESICEKMLKYAEINFEDGTSQMVRTEGFNGEPLLTKDFDLKRDKGKALKYQCHNFLEDHEEELITLFQLEQISDYEALICGEKTKVCSEEDLWSSMFKLSPVQNIDENQDDVDANQQSTEEAIVNEQEKSEL